MFEILIIAAIVVMALACRTSSRWILAKLGLLLLFTATYLAAYWISGSHVAGVSALGVWILLPWVEIVGRVRKLRFPMRSEVKHRFPPSRSSFPQLGEMSGEIEKAGFAEGENAGWKWEGTDNFIRIFYNAETRMQASINHVETELMHMSYVALTTRTLDGGIFTTSNYPYSFTLKLSPQHVVNRHLMAEDFAELLAEHEHFLTKLGVNGDDVRELDAENLQSYVECDMSHQIAHNLSVGVLEATDNGMTRYTWRGCFFLWYQVVKDMLLA